MPHPRSRRSTDIIAPGFGTQTDLERLARDLSEGSSNVLPISASFVNSMMNSRGRGRRSREAEPEDSAASAAPTSSAWADFMQEEGMDSAAKRPRAADGAGDDDNKEQTADEEGKKPASAAAAEGDSKSSAYELDFAKKKSKPTAGFLVQAGTLNSAIVGRGTIFQFTFYVVVTCH
jgi:type IV secretory pathway VirB10-like protein